MTKQNMEIVARYERATKTELSQVYARPSARKIESFEEIKREMRSIGGCGLKILGANCNFYSCAYEYTDENDMTHIVYHTYARRVDITLD